MLTPKEQITDLARKLRDGARLQDPVAKIAIDLIKLSASEAKESLVTADGDDMLRAQGAARLLQRMYRELTVEPPSITKTGE